MQIQLSLSLGLNLLLLLHASPSVVVAATCNEHEPQMVARVAQAEGHPDMGSVSGNVYRNHFFEFEYRFPEGWRVPEADKSPSGVQRGAKPGVHVLLFAFQPFPHVGTILVRAVELPSPEVSARQFLLDEFKAQEGTGGKPQGKPIELVFGGWQFYSANIRAKVGGAVIRQEHLVTIQKGYALEFSFIANEEGTFKTLHKTMESLTAIAAHTTFQPPETARSRRVSQFRNSAARKRREKRQTSRTDLPARPNDNCHSRASGNPVDPRFRGGDDPTQHPFLLLLPAQVAVLGRSD